MTASRAATRVAAFVLAASAAGVAHAEPVALQPPAGYRLALGPAKGDGQPCPAVPAPYTATLDFPSKYEGSDKARDTLNKDADARYRSRTQPITDLERGVVRQVTKLTRTARPGALSCVIGWLRSWAAADALLGASTTHTGKSLRKWSLGTIASSWVRLKFAAGTPLAAYPDDQKLIERWLSRIADQVVREWPADAPLEKFNNHSYWAGWALMATAVATDRQDLFAQSIKLYRVFESQVDADGYLPNELKRDSRAASYHNYAIGPLAMTAAFARASGVDLASTPGNALNRLARRAREALVEPGSFERKNGVAQHADGLEKTSQRAWLEPYCAITACSAEESSYRDAARPLVSTRLGGDLTALFGGRDGARQ